MIDGRGRLLPAGQGQPAGAQGRHRHRIRAGLFPPRQRAERRAVDDLAETTNKGHGRVEYRRLRSSPAAARVPGLAGRGAGVRAGAGAADRGRGATGDGVRDHQPDPEGGLGELGCWRWRGGIGVSRTGCTGSRTWCWARTPAGCGPTAARRSSSGLRNAALRLLHRNGLGAIASALRHLAAFPMKAIQLVTQNRITDL